MIYLEDSDELQTVWVPTSVPSQAVDYALILTSTVGLESFTVVVTNETPNVSDYARIKVNPVALGLTPGSWEYSLTSYGNVVAAGVLAVMKDMVPYAKKYDKNITYEQYFNGSDGE